MARTATFLASEDSTHWSAQVHPTGLVASFRGDQTEVDPETANIADSERDANAFVLNRTVVEVDEDGQAVLATGSEEFAYPSGFSVPEETIDEVDPPAEHETGISNATLDATEVPEGNQVQGPETGSAVAADEDGETVNERPEAGDENFGPEPDAAPENNGDGEGGETDAPAQGGPEAPVVPTGLGAEDTTSEQEHSYPDGEPNHDWKVVEIDAWAHDHNIEVSGTKNEKLDQIHESGALPDHQEG